MKLKSIMYALDYGKSEKDLKRSDGARRVKQAKTLMNERVAAKTYSFCERYGSSLNQTPIEIPAKLSREEKRKFIIENKGELHEIN